MIFKYTKKPLFILLFISFSLMAQTPQEKKEIIKNYDLSKLNTLREKYYNNFNEEKNYALLLAAQKGWQIKYTENGSYYELMKVSELGKPIYFKTYNEDAATSTRANFMHNGGGLGLDIEGQGMTAHVWDEGLARVTHQEYDGIGGQNRYSAGDTSTSLSNHGSHVMGTIIASGFDSAAKGMAPRASGVGYDWSNDVAEATIAAADGMLISNHSYGYGADGIPDWWFGAYTTDAREWDELMYNAPYYLHVGAAGNDGNNGGDNADPLEGNSEFDKLSGNKTSKNGLAIANGRDAVINVNGTLVSVDRNSGSSEGPTDDYRIKPDLMGNGTGLFSPITTSDSSYDTYTGTSMASPNVTGSLLLLQQYYNETNGSFMKAATLKGLALHTADDADIVGPDPHVGWGLLNTKLAAETIANNGFETLISEEMITNGSSYTIKVNSDGTSPLLASISWTDKPGVANTGSSNDPTAALVNDLDIRITKDGTEYKPWRLSGIYSNEKEDNLVDPFERVDIESPSGEYTITVTHKGVLEENQYFSLIVTGISGEFTFTTDTSEIGLCSNEEATFNFDYRQVVAGTTQFTAVGMPVGMNAVFSTQSLSADGSFNVVFGNLENIAAGAYDIEILGDNGTEQQKRIIKVVIYQSDFSDNPSSLELPANGERAVLTQVPLVWATNLNANSYTVQVAGSPAFSTILYSETTVGTNFQLSNLVGNTVYYWRIKPKNDCGTGEYSSIFSFQTGITDCSNLYNATDFSLKVINPFSTSATATIPISVSDNLIVSKIMLTTDITHSSVQELTVTLEAPASIGGGSVVLLSNACNDLNDISNTTFDDTAANLVCNTANPAISGTIAPANNMTNPFFGENPFGEWKLIVLDNALGNGGEVNQVNITICQSLENTSVPTFSSSEIVLAGNAAYTVTAANMSASSASETEAQQSYTLVEIPRNGSLEKEGSILSVGDTFTQADITASKIVFVSTQTVSFTDQFKVDINNAANGWLANQIITIVESTLSIDSFLLNDISFWPNPTKGMLNVTLKNTSKEYVITSLFDLQGREVMRAVDVPLNNVFTKEIETTNISSGIYLIKVAQGNKRTTKKILISK